MKKVTWVLIFLLVANVFSAGSAAETRWIICKPGAQVMIRSEPDKGADECGFLEVGDSFETDGKIRNGFIEAYGVGDGGGWIYCGYVVDEPPKEINERYICAANVQAACRRWVDGPRIKGTNGWLKQGRTVKVYFRTDAWSVTNRGYIRSEWLEPDPE